jgi:hypothetical protein
MRCVLAAKQDSLFLEDDGDVSGAQADGKSQAISSLEEFLYTSWSRVVLERSIVTQPVKKISVVDGTQGSITVLVRACNFSVF